MFLHYKLHTQQVVSKSMSLFLCMFTLHDIAHTALCLLLCKKLDIPSKAKPTKPDIIVLKIPL